METRIVGWYFSGGKSNNCAYGWHDVAFDTMEQLLSFEARNNVKIQGVHTEYKDGHRWYR